MSTGFNELIYRRTTDDDNTASKFHDRQFYVNHEASYESHEVVAFIDLSEDITREPQASLSMMRPLISVVITTARLVRAA